MHRRAERGDIAESLCGHAEEVQLAYQMLGALLVLQGDVHRLAQRRQERLVVRIAVAQSGAGKAIDQLTQCGDGAAGQTPAVVADVAQAILDVQRQLAVLGLLEAIGKAPKTSRRFGQRGMVVLVPFTALQLLPDLQHFPCLVDDPLGEMLFKLFLIRHRDYSWRARCAALVHCNGGMLSPSVRFGRALRGSGSQFGAEHAWALRYSRDMPAQRLRCRAVEPLNSPRRTHSPCRIGRIASLASAAPTGRPERLANAQATRFC